MKKLIITMAVVMSTIAASAKTLIVYYSFTNNVHRIVNDLKDQTGADVLRIEPAEEGLDYAANNYAYRQCADCGNTGESQQRIGVSRHQTNKCES